MYDLFLKLSGNWNTFVPQPFANLLFAFVAAFCGSIVGMEREKKDKPTGIRTLTLVCLGAAVFTMISEKAGDSSGRVIGQIVSGVGFLGAGAIMHRRFSVAGMTSAATIWVTAAIGTVAGLGYAGSALGISFFVLVVLTLTTLIEHAFLGNCHFVDIHVRCRVDGGKTMLKLEQLTDEFPAKIRLDTEEVDPLDDSFGITLRFCANHKLHRGILARLAEMPEVVEIHKGHRRLTCVH